MAPRSTNAATLVRINSELSVRIAADVLRVYDPAGSPQTASARCGGYSDAMRIVHVSDCFAPRVGGIESQVQELGIEQARAGHAVHVLTATAQDPDETPPGISRHRYSETISGVRVHRLASPAMLGVPVHPRGRSLITRALVLIEPDVVHVYAGLISPFVYLGWMAAVDQSLNATIAEQVIVVTVCCVLARLLK